MGRRMGQNKSLRRWPLPADAAECRICYRHLPRSDPQRCVLEGGLHPFCPVAAPPGRAGQQGRGAARHHHVHSSPVVHTRLAKQDQGTRLCAAASAFAGAQPALPAPPAGTKRHVRGDATSSRFSHNCAKQGGPTSALKSGRVSFSCAWNAS